MTGRFASFFIAALLGAITAYGQTSLDFEALADGAAVTSQIAGLTFSNAAVLTSGFSLDELEFPTHSGKNAVTDAAGPLTITFSPAVAGFSAYFTHSKAITVNAFNGAASVTSASSAKNNAAVSGDGSKPNEQLTVINASITKVVITGDPAGNSFVMDDALVTPVAASGGGGGGGGEKQILYTLYSQPAALVFDQLIGSPNPATQKLFLTTKTANKVSYGVKASTAVQDVNPEPEC